jgi:hypothetical protein
MRCGEMVYWWWKNGLTMPDALVALLGTLRSSVCCPICAGRMYGEYCKRSAKSLLFALLVSCKCREGED